jgi:hypothetical protein
MHSSWTSEDGNYLYSAREVTNSNGPSPGDIRVYNISNPAMPLLIRKISMNDLGLNAVTPHNPVVMEISYTFPGIRPAYKFLTLARTQPALSA